MKNGYLVVVAAGTLACAAGVWGQSGETKKDDASTEAAVPTVESPAAANPSLRASKIVVHVKSGPVADARDARVSVAGGMKISVPPGSGEGGATERSATDKATSPVREDGAIEVPNNTLGPGEALWQRNDRIENERRLAQAQADYAERLAERPLYDSWPDGGTVVYGGYAGYGYPRWRGYRHGPWRAGPAAPAQEPVYEDLGLRAQREFSKAAYPRLGAIEDGRAQAVINFGDNATPPIARIQNDVDRGVINARKDTFSAPEQPRQQPPVRKPGPRPRSTK